MPTEGRGQPFLRQLTMKGKNTCHTELVSMVLKVSSKFVTSVLEYKSWEHVLLGYRNWTSLLTRGTKQCKFPWPMDLTQLRD